MKVQSNTRNRTNTGHRGGPKTKLSTVEKALISRTYFRATQAQLRKATERAGKR